MLPKPKSAKCQICGTGKRLSDLVPCEVIRQTITDVIKKEHSNWNPQGLICYQDLNYFREKYIKSVLESQKGDFSALEDDVLKSMKKHELLTKNINAEFERKLSMGERLADKIASFGGSWVFIVIFGVIIFAWVSINIIGILNKPFDPFPFILLNLVLSCLAAIQAPIIMMSQNRLEARDRLRSENDYRINLKAELEIRHLHEKMDHLLRHQWQKLLEIQEIQTELMEDIMKRKRM